MSTSEKRPPRRGLGWWVSRALGVVALGAFALAARPRAEPQPPPAATQPPRAAGAEAETPARTAYRMALQSLRDCSYEPAVEQLERATKLDPSFASAHLRRVLVARPDEDMRQHFSDALALRSTLGDHERALLDAYEPWIRASPAESEERLLALALRERNNAETYYFLGKVRFFANNFEGAIEAYETAIKLDPEMLPAIRMRAFALVSLGRGDEAAAGYQECIRRSPTAASCVRESLELEGLEGRCEAALALGRKLIAIDPSSAASYELLAVLLEASGESEASVRIALAEAAERMPADQAASRQGELEGSLALMKGRLTEAAEGFRRAEVASHASPQETRREHMMSLRVDLALDMGNRRLAAQIARDYLARRAAWIPHAEFDPSIIAWAALYRAGEIAHDELDRLRREWLRPQPARQSLEPGLQWSFAFAAPVVTDRDAQEAVAALEHYLPLPGAWTRGANHDAWIGTAFARGGRPDDAVVYLTRSARSCFAWYYPMEAMQAANVLGDTLVAKGDIAGACDAYGRILRRWRAARPPSALFHRARARSEQLRCPE